MLLVMSSPGLFLPSAIMISGQGQFTVCIYVILRINTGRRMDFELFVYKYIYLVCVTTFYC